MSFDDPTDQPHADLAAPADALGQQPGNEQSTDAVQEGSIAVASERQSDEPSTADQVAPGDVPSQPTAEQEAKQVTCPICQHIFTPGDPIL